jgi:hypothetical protein
MQLRLFARAGLTLLIAAHLEVARRHGLAHAALGVALNGFQRGFVDVVIVVLPLVCAAGIWTCQYRAFLWLFAGSMFASAAFGIFYHYVLISPDNVTCLPTGLVDERQRFITSAGVLTIIDLGAALAAALSLFRNGRASPQLPP